MEFYNIIDGDRLRSSKVEQGVNPRNSEALWSAPIASTGDLDDAVRAATRAFKKWSQTSWSQRQTYILDLVKALESQRALIESILAKETGKSKLMAMIEVEHTIKFFKFNAAQKIQDEVVHDDADVQIIATHTPLGVVGAITPWNFPLVLAVGKIAAALVTGNCIIVKPSPFTPYATLKLAEIAIDVLPPGVFQVLNGDGALGQAMTVHPGIQKITFTGSTATGKRIMESASASLKRVTLELGGNDATIVCPDVDVDFVASQVIQGCFFHAGQMCVATKRVYVHNDIYDQFLKRFLVELENFQVNPSPDIPTIFGPIQNHMQHAIVQDLIADCKKNGYKVISSGASTESNPGYFIPPVVVENPPDNARIVQEEQFGPVIPILRWSTEEEVLERANATTSGLGACVWSSNPEHAEELGRKLEAGSVWINSFEKPLPMAYFSGHKQSGVGGEWGAQGLLAYCNTQSIHRYKSGLSGKL